MAISLVGHGTGVGGSAASVSVSAPSGIASGDILILVAGTYAANALSANNGYTELYDSGYVHVYWKRTTGSEGSTTVSGATDSVSAFISAFRGCYATDSPISGQTPVSASSSGTTITSPAFSTGDDNEMVVCAYGIRDNNSITTYAYGAFDSGGQNNYGTNTGSDSKAGIVYGLMTSAGSIGTVGVTQSSTDAWTVYTFSLIPFKVSSAGSYAQASAPQLEGAGTIGYSGTGALTTGAASLAGTGDDQISIERREGDEGEYAVVGTRAWGSSPWTDEGPFTPGTEYFYRARRVKSIGTSPYSSSSSVLMPGDPVSGTGALTAGAATMEGSGTVSAPSNASAITTAAVQVLGYGAVAAIVGNGVLTTGTAAADGDGAITQDFLSIERKTGEGGTYAVVQQAPFADGEWTDSGPFTTAVTYYYRARRYRNEGVSAYATEDTVTYNTLASAGAVTVGAVSLEGTGLVSGISGTGALQIGAVTAQGTGSTLADSITIERKVGAGGTYALMHVGSFSAGSWTDTSGFTTGETYYYRAMRTVDGVTSAWSNEASASFDSVTGTGAVTIGFVSLFGTQNAPTLFVSQMTGLTPGTVYYVAAYATNADGTGYGSDVTFTTAVTGSGTLTLPAGSMEGTAFGNSGGFGDITFRQLELFGFGTTNRLIRFGRGEVLTSTFEIEGQGAVGMPSTGVLTTSSLQLEGTGSVSIMAGCLTTATFQLYGSATIGVVIRSGRGELHTSSPSISGAGTISYSSSSGALRVAPIRLSGSGSVRFARGTATISSVRLFGAGTISEILIVSGQLLTATLFVDGDGTVRRRKMPRRHTTPHRHGARAERFGFVKDMQREE